VIEYVAVVVKDDLACGACKSVADRGYLPLRAPLLPNVSCTRAGGCRCRYEPWITVVE
jgi:hypothetical protein